MLKPRNPKVFHLSAQQLTPLMALVAVLSLLGLACGLAYESKLLTNSALTVMLVAILWGVALEFRATLSIYPGARNMPQGQPRLSRQQQTMGAYRQVRYTLRLRRRTVGVAYCVPLNQA